jgi:hydrogenase nickel incorporation protein HypA/HybF
MHEMSIAINVVDIAVDMAKKAEAATINEIVVDIGTLSGIIPESLEFCFDSACKDTMAEKSRLTLNIIPAIALCDQCGHEFEADSHVPLCPKCDNLCLQVSGGRDMKIKSINVD